MIVILIVLGSYLVFSLITGFLIVHFSVHPRTNDKDKEFSELQVLGFDCNEYLKQVKMEPFSCISGSGHEIHGDIICSEKSKKTVFLCHGYVGNRFSMLPYVKIYRNLGYNCVIFDNRNHGDCPKSFTSFGFYESRDLKTVFDYVSEKIGKQEQIGLHGVSMGAATVLMTGNNIKGLSFAVSDSSYTTMYSVVRNKISNKNRVVCRGAFIVAGLFLKLLFGFSFKDVRPVDCVLQMKDSFPVLFIHCKNDRIVPFYMFEKLYESKKGNKESFILENAGHAKAVFFDSENYQSHIESFLKSQEYLNE